ncbi:phosphatidate cytidylyltransferase [Fusobacterium massiliense]|uniref:phosphatidate cytidylyltransferase n=1 Tax=Fusobacterium massiliense TaxID=1852365 RepID=UPI00093E4B79|nr:phosphatidate cytidylyltransferase [Fusobacterium massiliense]
MFKWNRILVVLIGVPLLLFVYMGETFFDIDLYAIPMLIFTNLVVGIGTYEFYKMIKISGREVYDKFGIFVSLIIPNLIYFSNMFLTTNFGTVESLILILIFTIIIMLIHRIFKNQIKGTLEKISLTILGIVYVSMFFSQIINLYFIEPAIPLFLQALVWMSDTSAGIIGVSIGRKFFKNGFTEISPKKSVEGAIGSLIFTGLLAAFLPFFTNFIYFMDTKDIILFFIIGVFISFISQIGDLVESLFKRECGVKDSGTILMGHGGILDRFDSMILVLPVSIMLFYILNIVFLFYLN